MYDIESIRKDFPILSTKMNGKPLVYLDSAATSQKPNQVIDLVADFYRTKNSNAGRGIYKLAEDTTHAYESVRGKVKDFTNSHSETSVIFTKNTTEAANLVMYGWGEKFIKKGDKIVVSILEHHSNFVPWQQLALKKGASFEVMDIDENGQIKESELDKMHGAKFVAVGHVSNVTGTINNVEKICRIARDEGAVSLVDGAQSIPSMKIDMKKIGCDFFMFSGHKMLAPFGSGALLSNDELLKQMDPFFYGSEMIMEVYPEKSVWNRLPYKFEAGTPNVVETIGLGAAIDYMKKLGIDNIKKHKEELVSYALKRLQEIHGLQIIGPKNAYERGALVSFTMDKVHPHDIAAILDDDGIAIRSGHHCAMPLHLRLNLPGTARASFHLYNKKEEIDQLVKSLEKAKTIFGG